MEQDEPAVELYDFLYRDSGRITSYYAQIFGSHLSSTEETSAEQKGAEYSGKVDVKVVSGDAKSTSTVQRTTKRVLIPHDVITTDVLTFLTGDFCINKDVFSAPHGAVIITQGTVVFVDSSMGEVALSAFRELARAEQSKPKVKQDTALIQEQKLTLTMFEKITFPSGFFLATEDGIQIVGVIKDEGMEETIPSYYFKHGTSGLTDVYVVGIKEIPTDNFMLPNEGLIGVGQHAAQAMSHVLFPASAIRVTPIALFRKLI